MAEKKTPKKRIRKPETVRERAQKAKNAVDKPRRLSRTASTASKPLKTIALGAKAVLGPFRFILWPFKTRPVRFVGRILANILLLKYFRNSFRELKQVTWLKRREIIKLTFAVFVFATVFGLVVTVVDYGLDKVFKEILLN